jgi:hypothetical protein
LEWHRRRTVGNKQIADATKNNTMMVYEKYRNPFGSPYRLKAPPIIRPENRPRPVDIINPA